LLKDLNSKCIKKEVWAKSKKIKYTIYGGAVKLCLKCFFGVFFLALGQNEYLFCV